MIPFQSLTLKDLAQALLPLSKTEKQARLRARLIYHWVYQRFVTDWDQMTDLAKPLREWLEGHVEIYRLKERQAQQSLDGTCKFLWDLHDGKTIESVIIPAALSEKGQAAFSGREIEDEEQDLESKGWRRLTACISSQVGCAMACKFCLTGIQGLDRSLEVHEIVTQVFELRKVAPITNIVFMGMGEPLHNLPNIIQACRIFLDQDGLNFSKRKVTVSTSGLVPAMEELGQAIDVSLAISLNATTDEQRSEIMPVNKKWNIAELLKACRNYPLGSHRKLTFEYVLLKGFNDSREDAARLVRLLRGLRCKVNLIPFNEHSGSVYRRPSDDVVKRFQKVLVDRNLVTTVRISRGRDILAACGQLRSIFGTARGSERHKDWTATPNVGI